MKFNLTKYEMKKNKIIDAAFKCIYDQGINGISMRAISQEAKVNQALIHYYFGSKDNMLLEVLRALFNRFIYDLKKVLKPQDSSEDKVVKIFRHGEDYSVVQKELFVVLIEFWILSIRNKEMQQVLSELYGQVSNLIENILDEGIESGVFNRVKTDIISTQFMAFMQGICLRWLMADGSFDLRAHFAAYRDNLLDQIIPAWKNRNSRQSAP